MPREKTHVRIGRSASGGHEIVVDGVDMSYKVLAEGFRVEFATKPELPDLVHMVVAADTLDVDLPGVVLAAIRAEADDA